MFWFFHKIDFSFINWFIGLFLLFALGSTIYHLAPILFWVLALGLCGAFITTLITVLGAKN